jgi:hypothetical protein
MKPVGVQGGSSAAALQGSPAASKVANTFSALPCLPDDYLLARIFGVRLPAWSGVTATINSAITSANHTSFLLIRFFMLLGNR